MNVNQLGALAERLSREIDRHTSEMTKLMKAGKATKRQIDNYGAYIEERTSLISSIRDRLEELED